MQLTIINGPNLNLLGTREPGIYGNTTFEEFYATLQKRYPQHIFSYHQSNIEGEIVTLIQDAGFKSDIIILNAGGYTHTSVAIADAVGAIPAPVIEVHISHPLSREDYRHISIVGTRCKAVVSGFGLNSYDLAIIGAEKMLLAK